MKKYFKSRSQRQAELKKQSLKQIEIKNLMMCKQTTKEVLYVL